ncbi:MAG: hypothetical protein Q7R92_01660 [bacterium]|nr:hypothetical protein [bacterium]
MIKEKIKKTEIPDEILSLKNGHQLAYGENRCQSPATIFYGGNSNQLAISKFDEVSGQASFIALADLSQLVSILCLMSEAFRRSFGKVPFIALAGKHGNLCGAGISWNQPIEALLYALYGDSVAVMGGEFTANFEINDFLAASLLNSKIDSIGRDKWGLDVIAAPDFSNFAITLLGKREKRRLLANPALAEAPFPQEEWTYRELHGGDWLKQRLPHFVLSPGEVIGWTREQMDLHRIFESLIIAFACAWRASSNTVALAKDNMLIGLGCGQQDRIACVRLCLDRASRAGHDPRNSVFASDGFFPFACSTDYNADRIDQLMTAVRLLDANLAGKTESEKIITLNNFANLVSRLDRREGPELLADAGCIGGVVPADGIRLEEVKEFFQQKKMSVAFVAAENRGFSKH